MTEKTAEMILSYERRYSSTLAGNVIGKPRLSSLMIFIPFLFLFYIQDLFKYKKGLKKFTASYLSSREKALKEAVEAFSEKRKIKTEEMGKLAGLEGKAAIYYSEYLRILADHYFLLLKGRGDDYESLVRSAYKNSRKDYKTFTETLTETEERLSRSLVETEVSDKEEGSYTIKKIEKGNRNLRRKELAEIFS